MTKDNTGLDHFDRALLTELRRFAESPTASAPQSRRRWVTPTAGIAAVAASLGVVAVATLGPSTAFAVDQTSDGAVVITVHELSDADGLERALADHGINASVTYDGGPHAVSRTTGTDSGARDTDVLKDDASEIEPGGRTAVSGTAGSAGPADGSSPCGPLDQRPFDAEVRDDDYVITIPADSVLFDNDALLKITTSGDPATKFAGLAVSYSAGGTSCGFGSMETGMPTD